MHHPEARAEHVLIASVHWNDGVVDAILSSHGTTPEALKTAVLEKLDLPPSYGVAENATASEGPYETFDDDAKAMLTFAARAAKAAGHSGMNSHEFLLGLAALAQSGESQRAVRILGALGTTSADIRAEFSKFPAWSRRVESQTVSLSAEAKLVIEHAIHLAVGGAVRPEHLLVAMDGGDGNMASYVFRQLGISSERLRVLLGPSGAQERR
jgi:ATP-dependent Clp protease ATP-binding subunit ClpA